MANTVTSVQALQGCVNQVAKLAVRATAQAGSGHPSSALSIAHLVTYLMFREMRFDPARPGDLAADRLVLSEGHAVPAVYAAYALLGGAVGRPGEALRPLAPEYLDTLRELESVLDGHPNPAEGFPFFDAGTGSLGQGLSIAAGLALGARLTASPRRVFCIVGDGESREGQIWEAVDFIVDHALTNVCTIFNCNGHGQADAVSPQQSPERLAAKLRAGGFTVEEVDGHDLTAIASAVDKFAGAAEPFAIVARTVKGWGVDALLDGGNWHGKPLGPDALPAVNASLDRHCPVEGDDWRSERPEPPAAQVSPEAVDPRALSWPTLAEVLRDAGLEKALEKGAVATRRAYGAALKAAGRLLPQVCVLDADVSNSTMTDIFAKAHGERFVECKIAEQNMISAACGLAAAGCIPLCNTFAKFFARAYDQIEMANISRANIKLVGSHAGISPCADGPSQMALVDVAYFRSFGTVRADDREQPLLWLFQPADGFAAYALTRQMLAQRGMCYMRTFRPDAPLIYRDDTEFPLRGMHVLRSGEDLALVSAGFALHTALAAADLLAQQKVRATVIDAYCLPLDGARLVDLIHKSGNAALTVEDNYGGGLGAAVAEAAAERGSVRVRQAHCQRIPKSTVTPEQEFEYCGVAAGQVADQALALIRG